MRRSWRRTPRKEDARADYEAVRFTYDHDGMDDRFDIAVLSRDMNGKVHIVTREDEPTRQGAIGGLFAGFSVGVLVGLVPGTPFGASLTVGSIAGMAIGAIAGHLVRGLGRAQVRDLGYLLDRGESGLVVVADRDLARRAEWAITRAKVIEAVADPTGGRTGRSTDVARVHRLDAEVSGTQQEITE
jgi:uncharacterized membrane protein